MVTHNPQNGYTLFTPKVHAVTIWCRKYYTRATPMMHEGYTQVTFGLQPSHTWVTPGGAPENARIMSELVLVHARLRRPNQHVLLRRTPAASGSRLGCSCMQVLHQRHAKVTTKSHMGGTRGTPWSRPGHALATRPRSSNTRCTTKPHRHVGCNPGVSELDVTWMQRGCE